MCGVFVYQLEKTWHETWQHTGYYVSINRYVKSRNNTHVLFSRPAQRLNHLVNVFLQVGQHRRYTINIGMLIKI